MSGPQRLAVRDDLVALEGYHSPQVEVPVRLNTNESPFPPPPAFAAELARAVADVTWHRYPDRAATQLRERIVSLGGDGAPDYDENFADSGQVAAEQGENQVLLNQLRDQLEEVDRAVAKFESGRYGVCERCGQAIAEPRLEAMPATRYCIEHA